MPLMADGKRLTLGRVPSREREKDEERESARARKETKIMEQRSETNNPYRSSQWYVEF